MLGYLLIVRTNMAALDLFRCRLLISMPGKCAHRTLKLVWAAVFTGHWRWCGPLCLPATKVGVGRCVYRPLKMVCAKVGSLRSMVFGRSWSQRFTELVSTMWGSTNSLQVTTFELPQMCTGIAGIINTEGWKINYHISQDLCLNLKKKYVDNC